MLILNLGSHDGLQEAVLPLLGLDVRLCKRAQQGGPQSSLDVFQRSKTHATPRLQFQ